MAYNTYYSLEIMDAETRKIVEPELFAEVMEVLKSEIEAAEYALEDDGGSAGEETWYEHHEEMLEFSRKYPGLVFCLHGEGESTDDLWDAYYMDGKIQECPARIEYDEFDPAKLV